MIRPVLNPHTHHMQTPVTKSLMLQLCMSCQSCGMSAEYGLMDAVRYGMVADSEKQEGEGRDEIEWDVRMRP